MVTASTAYTLLGGNGGKGGQHARNLVSYFFCRMLFSEQQSLQPKFLPTANKLHRLGFTLYATEATSQYLNEHNIPAQSVEWPLHTIGVNPAATR